MEKTCGSYSHEYSNRICYKRLRRIQPTSEELGTNIAASQQLVQGWELIIPEPTSEHIC